MVFLGKRLLKIIADWKKVGETTNIGVSEAAKIKGKEALCSCIGRVVIDLFERKFPLFYPLPCTVFDPLATTTIHSLALSNIKCLFIDLKI